MKKLILKTLIFTGVLIVALAFIFFLPPTPRVKSSLLFAENEKDSLLMHVEPPRIIFVGGSNLSFGLNSQMIKDSLNLNPINTAIHVGIGLKYMLDNTYQYIKKGDIIVLVPEYQHFYSDYDKGSEELFRTVMDVKRSNIKLLNIKQIINCAPYVIGFISSKLNSHEYGQIIINDSDAYSVTSFNQYGDVYRRPLGKQKIKVFDTLKLKDYHPEVIQGIKEFEQKIRQKGAVLFISYPCCQDSSFNNSKEAIDKVEKEYIKNGFTILGTPERYRMNDTLILDFAYHLNKKGAIYRTKLLIEDLKIQLKQQLAHNIDSLGILKR